jgi:hypothetical protein
VVVATAVAGLMVLRMRSHQLRLHGFGLAVSSPKIHWGRIIALEIAAFSALAFLAVLGGRSVDRADVGLDGVL